MIIKDIKVYDGLLIHDRFAYTYFRQEVSPYGNIVAFRAPMEVGISGMIDKEDVLSNDFIWSNDAINFCWEIPNLDKFGAVAFQRLLNIQIASILSNGYLKKPIEIDGDDLMVNDPFVAYDGKQQEVGKCSVSITYSKNNVALGHTGINVFAGNKAPTFAYSTLLNNDQTEQFMSDVCIIFNSLVKDIFIATTKVIG